MTTFSVFMFVLLCSVHSICGLSITIIKIIFNSQGKQEFGQYTYDLDLALIRTAEPIKFTDTVQPIALPTRNTVMKENVTAVVSGWESGKVS